MRRSFDGLAQAVRSVLRDDPQSGALFVFMGKRKNRLKVLWWDVHGYCLLCKRLHRAVFVVPPAHVAGAQQSEWSQRLSGEQLGALLAGVPRQRGSKEEARALMA